VACWLLYPKCNWERVFSRVFPFHSSCHDYFVWNCYRPWNRAGQKVITTSVRRSPIQLLAHVMFSFQSKTSPPSSEERCYLDFVFKVKVKLSLGFLFWAPRHEGVLGSGSIAPRILDLCGRWRWVVNFTYRPLYPQGKSPWYPLDRFGVTGMQMCENHWTRGYSGCNLERLLRALILYSCEYSWIILYLVVCWGRVVQYHTSTTHNVTKN
jgi:hypothetical protein